MKKGFIYYATVLTPFLLIINLGLGSQADPFTIAGFPLNQVVNWLVILGAAIVVMNTYRTSLWPVIIVTGVIFSKLVSLVLGNPFYVVIFYKIFLLALFFAVGVIYIYRYLDLVYKTVLIICLFNVIMMILQLSNAGDWTQFLSTGSGFKYGEKITYDTLFIPLDQLQYSVIQGRPSGFLRSNIVLSGVLLFALALHFSRDKNRLKWGTITLCAMIVLASARIVYVGYFLMCLLLLFKGNRVQRKAVLYSVVTIMLVLMVYSYFFPGLFQRYWTYEILFSSFFVRINDIISQFDTESTIRIFLEKLFRFIPHININEGDPKSGYTVLVRYLPYLIPLLLILLPYYVKRLRRQSSIFPHLTWVTILCLLIFLLYPAAFPIFRDQFYWMVGGFALSPLFILLPPHYFKKAGQSKKVSPIV